MSGFHGAFATGVASQQGTLTLPDTWFRPLFWDLLMLQLLRPNSSNLPCLYSTFHLEYPLVLSRFCLEVKYAWLESDFTDEMQSFDILDHTANNMLRYINRMDRGAHDHQMQDFRHNDTGHRQIIIGGGGG